MMLLVTFAAAESAVDSVPVFGVSVSVVPFVVVVDNTVHQVTFVDFVLAFLAGEVLRVLAGTQKAHSRFHPPVWPPPPLPHCFGFDGSI